MAAAKKRRKEGCKDCTSSGHITNLKQSIYRLSISMNTAQNQLLFSQNANTIA
jgi:hypothetical protein